VLGSAALGVGLEHEREEPPSGGAARAGRARTSMLLSCAVSDLAGREGPGLALLLGLRAELPIDGLGSNEPTGMAASVGLRYAMEGFAR
jgi:hypothetical protein